MITSQEKLAWESSVAPILQHHVDEDEDWDNDAPVQGEFWLLTPALAKIWLRSFAKTTFAKQNIKFRSSLCYEICLKFCEISAKIYLPNFSKNLSSKFQQKFVYKISAKICLPNFAKANFAKQKIAYCSCSLAINQESSKLKQSFNNPGHGLEGSRSIHWLL